MRIEDVQSPCVSLMDAAEIMREAGFRVSVHKLKAGICQGVYPFGECVERAPGLTKNDVYTIYTAGLADWLEQHRWPRKEEAKCKENTA